VKIRRRVGGVWGLGSRRAGVGYACDEESD
jgi:hypothetical protein